MQRCKLPADLCTVQSPWWHLRGGVVLELCLKNPVSSLPSAFSPMTELCATVLTNRVCVWLGAFGAETPKPFFAHKLVGDGRAADSETEQ